jgi:drug/metabolite transporter (DMT)-like permease
MQYRQLGNSGVKISGIGLGGSLTLLAMLAFAANSLLCRLALGEGLIDAASFTTVRMVSGALTLLLFVLPRWLKAGRAPADWRSATLLFAYMACFSFAYLSLSAGTGALLLFGAVQLTMFVAALRAGEHFAAASWAGLALAVAGLVYLVAPGVSAPDPAGARPDGASPPPGALFAAGTERGTRWRQPPVLILAALVLVVSLLFL